MTDKITRTAVLFAAAAFVAGASMPAMAADPSAKADAKPAKERRYCVEQVQTGSMLKKPRVCKTRDEWIAETGLDPARK